MSTFSNPLTEYSPQMEFESGPVMESEDESGPGPFDELQELELAVRLLDAVSETDLDRSLHDIVHQAQVAIGRAMPAADARGIKHVLQAVVRRLWPREAMQSAAGHERGPIGAQFGKRLSSIAGPILGIELEGLSEEDREFEAARQFVRFAGDAVSNALERGPGIPPHEGAHQAVSDAAAVYAPGLSAHRHHTPQQRGRWIARDNRIVLIGA